MAQSISYKVLRMVLAQANKDQNQHYPPSVFEEHMELTTNWLITECVRHYPEKIAIDILNPYMKKELKIVKDGVIPRPKDMRNVIGFGNYYLNSKEENDKLVKSLSDREPSEEEIKKSITEKQCKSDRITEVSINRWNHLTKHDYKSPTYEDAIVCAFDNTGYKICPFDTPFAEIRFTIKTNPYIFGYGLNPDDTYYFDADKTTEVLWEDSATEMLFKGVNKLYSAYVRDPEHYDAAKELNNVGLF